MFYVFIEFDGPYGRSRMSRGFTTAEAREEWASQQHPCYGDEWSDYEEWEAPQEEWSHIRILA
jgi:hypothetical protein